MYLLDTQIDARGIGDGDHASINKAVRILRDKFACDPEAFRKAYQLKATGEVYQTVYSTARCLGLFCGPDLPRDRPLNDYEV